jgi:hypothetical protein
VSNCRTIQRGDYTNYYEQKNRVGKQKSFEQYLNGSRRPEEKLEKTFQLFAN